MIPSSIERKIDQAITDHEFLLAAGDARAPPPEKPVRPKDDLPPNSSPK